MYFYFLFLVANDLMKDLFGYSSLIIYVWHWIRLGNDGKCANKRHESCHNHEKLASYTCNFLTRADVDIEDRNLKLSIAQDISFSSWEVVGLNLLICCSDRDDFLTCANVNIEDANLKLSIAQDNSFSPWEVAGWIPSSAVVAETIFELKSSRTH